MVRELDYNTIAHVVDTWELAKQTPAFEEAVGTKILTRLFKAEPRTKKVFGFTQDTDIEANPLAKMGALIHAKRMIHMLEGAMSMLGPDTELLTEVLSGLGKRHIEYGVKACYLPFMGVAIIESLSELLGSDVWNAEVEEAWEVVYEELSGDIMKAILSGSEQTSEMITTRVL
mmetsp:Transcript_14100/g.30719  ORF Transcript_14100/g.30719 Transcript_14100/m.30719 type:complete len:173 (+) Transcript_14100:59-577(+)|eukprot:CAMPEP_0168742964 /NCGR_PEP_ID=MMETSP0724-20121128/13313_1 /TAXON_ID=265536 /ORGANISM="Amphiprora sp., Strain CCMP467" /LENGTH=172 /DNA_ID=CAMNT_0008790541 /DNA_START=284 /DNA_END=802 /DNA_ORIENTATION=-